MTTPETMRRKPRRRTGEGGRRLHSAGSAIVVSAAGLAVALLLNAPGLHKSATIQPEGWKRDLALAATEPLAGVSGALLLDQPRRALKAALGRSDDDEIDTAVALPEGTPEEAPGAETPATPPKRERFSPERKLRLWIAGDSLVVVPGESLLRAVAGNRAITPLARSTAGSRAVSSGPTSSTGSHTCASRCGPRDRRRSFSCSAATTTMGS